MKKILFILIFICFIVDAEDVLKTKKVKMLEPKDIKVGLKFGEKFKRENLIEKIINKYVLKNGIDFLKSEDLNNIINLNEIEAISWLKIYNYLDDSKNNEVPSELDFLNLGIDKIKIEDGSSISFSSSHTEAVLVLLKNKFAKLQPNTLFTNIKLQSIIDEYSEEIISLSKISEYISSNGTSPAPSIKDYRKVFPITIQNHTKHDKLKHFSIKYKGKNNQESISEINLSIKKSEIKIEPEKLDSQYQEDLTKKNTSNETDYLKIYSELNFSDDDLFNEFDNDKTSFEDNYFIYIVEDGDRLFSIARKFNVNPYKLIEFNELDNEDKLKIGKKLKIPSQITKTSKYEKKN